MISRYTILQFSNKTALVFLFLSMVSGSDLHAQFLSDSDRRIAEAVVGEFRRNCAQRVVVEADVVERVREAEKTSRADGNKEADSCFRESLSLMSGVYYIYEKLCNSITSTPVRQPDHILGRRLLNVSKYQSGVRPFHGQLSNCLVSLPQQRGRKYLTALGSLNLTPEVMTRAINSISVPDPFPASQVPFR